jgi:flagella basal body P-ring formation protein FlgA
MIKQRRKTVGTFWLSLLICAPLQAETTSHQAIRETVRQHAETYHAADDITTEVEVGRLDSRLKLDACDQPIEAFDSPNGLRNGRGVIGVRCPGSTPWKLYVPVSIATLEDVVVARRPLVRGQALTAADLALEPIDTNRLHKAYFTRVEDVVGLRSKRAVSAGEPVYASQLKREQLVRRNSRVAIIANTGGLLVTMSGKALADGGRGDRIRVENLDSGREVTGTVTGRGVIEVAH